MEIPREPRRSQVVNLTPLIDVVFLLIVFFMLSTSFTVSESMELSIPPKRDGAQDNTQDDAIWVLRVNARGQVVQQEGGDVLSLGQFNDMLRRKLRGDSEQEMLVLAEAEASVQQLVSVLDMIYLAGGRRVLIDKEE